MVTNEIVGENKPFMVSDLETFVEFSAFFNTLLGENGRVFTGEAKIDKANDER